MLGVDGLGLHRHLYGPRLSAARMAGGSGHRQHGIFGNWGLAIFGPSGRTAACAGASPHRLSRLSFE